MRDFSLFIVASHIGTPSDHIVSVRVKNTTMGLISKKELTMFDEKPSLNTKEVAV